tara:strand:- start:559 stop:855 length:297 start_codon:yes stop_codon:yes gene_type:complete
MKKVFLILFFSVFLTGCFQSTAYVGPAITAGSSGNIYKTGMSYASNVAFQKTTGMTTTEYAKYLLENKTTQNSKFKKNFKAFVEKHISSAREKIFTQN